MKKLTPHLLLLISPMLVCLAGCEMPEVDQPVTTPVVEDSPPEEAEVTETEPAEPQEFTANDPKKGKSSRSAGGYAGAVFGARFWAEHQMTINLIKKGLSLYNAEHGNYPKTHDEFMEKIIDDGQIQLPELDQGQEYIYDPEDHTLKFQAVESGEDLAAEVTPATEEQTPETDER